MFSFTFNLEGSTPTNPFTAQAEEERAQAQRPAVRRKLPVAPRRPSPAPSTADDVPRTRKRGWVPTSSTASKATSQPTVTSGWIDTPAKYLAQASQSHGGADEDDTQADFPPAKRRKTLADSIISTAFSAALIGTAVGMTAYRMWRDRGISLQEPESPHVDAPPPYQEEEWIDDTPRAQPAGRTSRLHKKARPAARRVPRHRKTPIAISPARSPARVLSTANFPSAIHEELRDDQGELEEQMDWVGDKIRQLIEEGKKALGKEIVIRTDEQQDEEEGAIDDGMEGWEEEDHDSSAAGPSVISPNRRPTHALPIRAATSLATPRGRSLPTSYTNAPTIRPPKRSLYTAGGGHTETSPALGSLYLGNPKG